MEPLLLGKAGFKSILPVVQSMRLFRSKLHIITTFVAAPVPARTRARARLGVRICTYLAVCREGHIV